MGDATADEPVHQRPPARVLALDEPRSVGRTGGLRHHGFQAVPHVDLRAIRAVLQDVSEHLRDAHRWSPATARAGTRGEPAVSNQKAPSTTVAGIAPEVFT